MSAGNLKNDALKGNNHPYQFNVLRSLGAISAAAAGGATEATAVQILAAIQSGTEFEARLVEDTLNVTWLEVRTWNTSTGGWNPPLYYPPGSNTPGTPTGAVVYINNSSVLAMIESNTTGINLEVTQLLIKGVLDAIALDTANLDVASSTLASEVTLLLTNALLTTIDADTSLIAVDTAAMVIDLAAIEVLLTNIKSDTAAMVVDLAAIEVLVTTTNGLLTIMDAVLDEILVDTGLIEGYLAPTVRGITTLREITVTSGNIPAGARSASFYNAHATANCTIGGTTVKPGEAISFDAGGQGDTLPQINWSTLVAADLLITSVV